MNSGMRSSAQPQQSASRYWHCMHPAKQHRIGGAYRPVQAQHSRHCLTHEQPALEARAAAAAAPAARPAGPALRPRCPRSGPPPRSPPAAPLLGSQKKKPPLPRRQCALPRSPCCWAPQRRSGHQRCYSALQLAAPGRAQGGAPPGLPGFAACLREPQRRRRPGRRAALRLPRAAPPTRAPAGIRTEQGVTSMKHTLMPLRPACNLQEEQPPV